eukprot:UN13067
MKDVIFSLLESNSISKHSSEPIEALSETLSAAPGTASAFFLLIFFLLLFLFLLFVSSYPFLFQVLSSPSFSPASPLSFTSSSPLTKTFRRIAQLVHLLLEQLGLLALGLTSYSA